jgi:hypothetical protein
MSYIPAEREQPSAANAPSIFNTAYAAIRAAKLLNKEKWPRGSAQPLENARFGQDNPKKSKPFPLIFFARAWLDFAGFGYIWF